MAEFTVTPWEVKGEVDYDKLIRDFGTQPLEQASLQRLRNPITLLRRGFYFCHRDFDQWLADAEQKKRASIVTGRGPSERMQIGHLVPLLVAKYFQDAYGCDVFIPVSEDEKYFVKEQLSYADAERHAEDNILDIIAVGFNPDKTFIHRDFQYTSIYKHAAKVAKHVTYSTAKAVFGLTPEHNLGWTFYPAMQSAHILLPQFLHGPHRTLVPIGIDQDPYMRIVRDVAEHRELGFRKPAAVHCKFIPSLKGPGTKMSASDPDSAIWLNDGPKEVERKVMKYAFSGGRATIEEHRRLGGNPDVDVPYQWLRIFEEDDKRLAQVEQDYRSGKLLTGEMKQILVQSLNSFLAEHQKRRQKAASLVDKFLLKDGKSIK
ncbi:tryptophan--tRNA ligase [Candidatus Woesearchaeota archaeon]|nr:tryptophan--tRNA ligase [Candidatus Woesearchaeota archaeon]